MVTETGNSVGSLPSFLVAVISIGDIVVVVVLGNNIVVFFSVLREVNEVLIGLVVIVFNTLVVVVLFAEGLFCFVIVVVDVVVELIVALQKLFV